MRISANDGCAVIWDSNVLEQNATNKIELKYLNATTNDDDTTIFETVDSIPNERGYALIEMKEEWLNKSSSTNFTIFLVSQGDTRSILSGPIITLVRNSTSRPSAKQSNKVGVKAGIPVGLAVVVVALLVLCFCMKKQRKSAFASIMGRPRGTPTGSRAQRTSGVTNFREGDVGSGGGRFRDEPDRGVELQDRGRARHSREGSFGSWGSSPTQEGLGIRGQGESNVFRDEISRQRRDHDA